MTKPDIFDLSVPVTSGAHQSGQGQCSVELLGMAIYGDMRHGYQLPCIDAGAQSAVIAVTDRISTEAKQTRRWRLIIARLATCHKTDNERVIRRMALWAARSVEHLSNDPRVKACNDMTERFINGEATPEELAGAAQAAGAAWPAGPAGAAGAAGAAWAAGAAGAAWAERDDACIDWVEQYLDQWLKVAADEGCLLPDIADAEYLDFVERLDWTMSGGS